MLPSSEKTGGTLCEEERQAADCESVDFDGSGIQGNEKQPETCIDDVSDPQLRRLMQLREEYGVSQSPLPTRILHAKHSYPEHMGWT